MEELSQKEQLPTPKHNIDVSTDRPLWKNVFISIMVIVILILAVSWYLFINIKHIKTAEVRHINTQQTTQIPFPTADLAKDLSEPVTNWKTYTRQDLNYTIKYPNDWSINTRDDQPIYSSFSTIYLSPNAPPCYSNPSSCVLPQYRIGIEVSGANCPGVFFQCEFFNTRPKSITIGNYTGYEDTTYDPNNHNWDTLYLQFGNKNDYNLSFVYRFFIDDSGTKKIEQQFDPQLFHKIVSTFSILNPSQIPDSKYWKEDTSTWKTYTNAQYGYQIKYPPSTMTDTPTPEVISEKNINDFSEADFTNNSFSVFVIPSAMLDSASSISQTAKYSTIISSIDSVLIGQKTTVKDNPDNSVDATTTNTYLRIPDMVISKTTWKAFKEINNFENNYGANLLVYTKRDNNYYIIATGGEVLADYYTIASTFRFTN